MRASLRTRNFKSIALFAAVAFALGFLALGFTPRAHAAGSSYWTNTVKVGVGHFAYGETAGDSNSGTAYTITDRLNYHNGLFLGTLRAMGGYVPANYTDGSVTGNVHYSLNDFSAGAGADVRMLNGYMQNQIYVSLGQFTNSFMAGNSSFTGGVTGYDEYYTVDYLGLTYKNVYAFTPRLSNVLKLNYLYGLNGTATSKGYEFFDAGYQIPNIQNDLSGEHGYGIAEGARYRLTDNLSLVGDVYYSALFYKSSNTAFAFYEPSSMTHQYGLQVGVRVAF
jgi:hypothetical protein